MGRTITTSKLKIRQVFKRNENSMKTHAFYIHILEIFSRARHIPSGLMTKTKSIQKNLLHLINNPSAKMKLKFQTQLWIESFLIFKIFLVRLFFIEKKINRIFLVIDNDLIYSGHNGMAVLSIF